MASAKTHVLVEGVFAEAEHVLSDGLNYRVLETVLLRAPGGVEEDDTKYRPYGYLEFVSEE